MTPGIPELEELRIRLLDLSLRNNLLNYKPSSARSIGIIASHLAETYQTLVLDEKGMKFQPGEKDTTAAAEEKNIWKYPIFSRKQTDRIFDTPYTDIELRKKLDNLQSKSRTVLEEQGYPVLYLALGFVEWTGADKKTLKAPLLLIPVGLERKKIKENYTLVWTGEDPVVSLSLAAKLAELGISLPELGHPETAQEVGAFFDAVEATLRQKNMQLLAEIVLDLFSFKKYVMFKDLDPQSWGEGYTIEKAPLINCIFHPETMQADVLSAAPPTLPAGSADCYNIMDADSSQLAVIEEAKNGKNLVVEGPPGTGKSQTIANMIAEMLARKKTVLFVSEKLAALEVVKRRLDAAGLSRFCLELHSQTAKKGELVRELERSIQHPSPAPVADVDRSKIDSLEKDLASYCEELRTPIGSCGFNPYDLFGIREQYRYEFENSAGRKNYRLAKVSIERADAIGPAEYQAAIAALADIEAYLPVLLHDAETVSSHPWAETRPGLILPSDRDEIYELVVTYQTCIEKLLTTMRKIADTADLPLPRSETEISIMMETCRRLTRGFSTTPGILNNSLWKNTVAVEHLISKMKNLSGHREKILQIFSEDIFKRNPARLYSEYLTLSEKSSIGKLFSSDYKRIRGELTTFYGGALPPDTEILNDLKDARNYLTERDEWRGSESAYLSLFAPVWKGEDTDPGMLQEYRDWIYAILTMMQEGLASSRTIERLCSGALTPAVMQPLFDALEEGVVTYSEARTVLFARLSIPESEADAEFSQLRRFADIWITNIDRLEEWSKFLTYLDVCSATTAAPLIPLLFTDKISAEALIPAYLTGYADALLKEAYQTRPALAHFAQIPHEQKIAAFKEYDRQAVALNSKRIVQMLDANVPEMFAGASRDSEMGILTGEFNRKRGHMSIRMMMTKAGGLIQKIKPCFMMSPLSAAQYLDPRSVQFDIIIFDEASQVKPEDALGALMRGKQLVVMGDSRQLPPTTFFEKIGGADEEEDETESVAAVTDMESLLHVCKQVFPTRRLRCHYRSRHESLITVSNAEFYDGTLMVFPSPMHDTPELGLSLIQVPDAVYERGRAGVNRGEAKAVAAAVISYYERFPDKTLGVATFSTKQQEIIRREVDLLLRDNPDVEIRMRPANGENFFVKNLETVQGDERDTILISIGYGFDENHRLSRNFGPLNQEGGERRLNVLITRARERCVVFSNFRGFDLPVDAETSAGVSALAAFLSYAETRNTAMLSQNADDGEETTELFSETVARMLEEAGYTVERNVGCAGFRIDLAVADVKNPGVYLAGVLCDGPYYWSAEDTRDRDRLRGQVLEGLGWNLIRVWSAEWFQHPASCTKILLDFLAKAEMNDTAPQTAHAASMVPAETVETIEDENEPEELEETKVPETEKEEPEEAAPIQSPAGAGTAVVPYVCCESSVLQSYNQFASVPDSVLTTAILEIAAVEGPVSDVLLAARIKELGRVPRMTPAIKNRIAALTNAAAADCQLVRDEEGYISIPAGVLNARERSGKWSIDTVALAEIAYAAQILLTKQFATPRFDLVRQTAIVLGFKATSAVKQRVEEGVTLAVSKGMVSEENGICSAVHSG